MPVFCLCTGRCGSQSIVDLLKRNGVEGCHHEKYPALFREAIGYYYGLYSRDRIVAKLRETRQGVFFEANNKLFPLAKPLFQAFPDAKFMVLHRDGREVVRSALQSNWYHPKDPYGMLRLGARMRISQFKKVCRYWSEVYRRIYDDLASLDCEFIEVRFDELIKGKLADQLGKFIGRRLRLRVPRRLHRTKRWTVKPYAQWKPERQREFRSICGPMMERLGYSFD